MSHLTRKGEDRLARPLVVLVPMIRQELAAGETAGLAHYQRAGEMLIEAKDQVEHGAWKEWLDEHFALSQSQAIRYMRLARIENLPKGENLKAAIGEPVGAANPAWHEPVRRILPTVNLKRLAEERQARAREEALIRDLGLKLISIGYKVLAAKLHPDKPGGSTAAMARLTKVRDRLKGALG